MRGDHVPAGWKFARERSQGLVAVSATYPFSPLVVGDWGIALSTAWLGAITSLGHLMTLLLANLCSKGPLITGSVRPTVPLGIGRVVLETPGDDSTRVSFTLLTAETGDEASVILARGDNTEEIFNKSAVSG